MRQFMCVVGKGTKPIHRSKYKLPQGPCKMMIRLWRKAPIVGKETIDVCCENPLTLAELSEEIESISAKFFKEFDDRMEMITLEKVLEGKESEAYAIKHAIPSYGYDVFEV